MLCGVMGHWRGCPLLGGNKLQTEGWMASRAVYAHPRALFIPLPHCGAQLGRSPMSKLPQGSLFALWPLCIMVRPGLQPPPSSRSGQCPALHVPSGIWLHPFCFPLDLLIPASPWPQIGFAWPTPGQGACQRGCSITPFTRATWSWPHTDALGDDVAPTLNLLSQHRALLLLIFLSSVWSRPPHPYVVPSCHAVHDLGHASPVSWLLEAASCS